jgi:hypothetical protein
MTLVAADGTLLEAVMQDYGSFAGPGCVVRRQLVIPAKGQRKLGDLTFPAEQDFLDQLQFGVPAFGLAGSSNPGNLTRSATDWVPWECLAAQMANLV